MTYVFAGIREDNSRDRLGEITINSGRIVTYSELHLFI